METHLFSGQKVKGQGHESQKHCRRGSLHSCECWLLLVASTEPLRLCDCAVMAGAKGAFSRGDVTRSSMFEPRSQRYRPRNNVVVNGSARRHLPTASKSLRMMDTSLTGHFAYCLVISPTRHFAYYLDSSPTDCSSFYQQDYQSKIKSDV